MKNRGFSLIEMLIATFIFTMILSSLYTIFNNFFSNYKIETKNIETEVESVVNINLLKTDLIHTGLGLADDQNDEPINWDGSTLTIRSTLNATNNTTDGWILVDCTSGWSKLSGDNISTGTDMVFLNASNKSFVANGSCGTCPSAEILLGFPYDSSVTSGCSTQFCNIIKYTLSTSQTVNYCNSYTFNLIRRTGSNAINNTGGSQILNCVADFQVFFDYDSDDSGIIESDERNISIPSSDSISDIKNRLKAINVFILFQEGKKDINYNFANYITVSGYNKVIFFDRDEDGSCDSDDVCLSLPTTSFKNYRWKKIYIKVKPESL